MQFQSYFAIISAEVQPGKVSVTPLKS